MKILHRGVTLELEDTDMRVRLMEVILFGDPLPPPLPAPLVNRPQDLPHGVRSYWKLLGDREKQELVLLAERPYRAAELEAALGVTWRYLLGTHSRMARLANKHKVPLSVRATGRTRKGRRYMLHAGGAELIQQLQTAGLAPPTPV